MRSFGFPELLVVGFVVVAVVLLIQAIRDLRLGKGGYFSVTWSGAIVGGIIGFLLRPSVPGIGQVSLGDVLTRGGDLRGFDVLLKGAAETSFNYLVAGVILGGVISAIVAKSGALSPPTHSQHTNPESPPVSQATGFCTKCGKPLSTASDEDLLSQERAKSVSE